MGAARCNFLKQPSRPRGYVICSLTSAVSCSPFTEATWGTNMYEEKARVRVHDVASTHPSIACLPQAKAVLLKSLPAQSWR